MELESFTDYLPGGSKKTGTQIGPPKGGCLTFEPKSSRSYLNMDGDGDTLMTSTDGILAANKDLKLQNSKSSQARPKINGSRRKTSPGKKKEKSMKPRAPWRSTKELIRLIEKKFVFDAEMGTTET